MNESVVEDLGFITVMLLCVFSLLLLLSERFRNFLVGHLAMPMTYKPYLNTRKLKRLTLSKLVKRTN